MGGDESQQTTNVTAMRDLRDHELATTRVNWSNDDGGKGGLESVIDEKVDADGAGCTPSCIRDGWTKLRFA